MIRQAIREDIPTIMSIVRSAQCALAELGIDQWQDGYPSVEAIENDIEQGVGYVACNEQDVPIGYAAIVLTGEEAYKQIIGIPDRKTRGGGGGDTGDAVKLRDGWADIEIVARIKEQYFIAKVF